MNAHDTSHVEYDALAAGYALSSLEPEDEQQFLAHLPDCAICKRAVAEHTDTLAHLAYAVASEAPPASVLEGIRAGVSESGRGGAFPAPLPLEVARTRRADRSVRMMTALVGAAAALVLVAALVFVNSREMSQGNDDQLRNAVAAVLVPGSRKIELAGDGGRGAVIVNGQRVTLFMSGVASNDPRSSIYVLWQKSTGGDVRAVGTFDVTSTDLAVIDTLRLDQTADRVRSFIVTRENGRVAPDHTSQPPVVAGDA